VQAGVLEMFVCLHLRWQGNPRTKARSWQEIGTYRRKRGPPLAPRSTPKSSVYTAYLILRCAPAASGHVAAVPPMSVMNSRRLIAFPSRTSKNFDGTPRFVVRENSSGFRRLTLRKLNPFIVNVVP